MPPPLATDLFDYALPARLIAQTPADRRDQSRLLVADRARRSLDFHHFSDLPAFLRPGDVLFRNNAAVLPARLEARRPSGGRVECFLLHPAPTDEPAAEAARPVWKCLLRPGRKLPVGATFADEGGAFAGEIVARETDGSAWVRFSIRDGESVTSLANRLGSVPLPPYIERDGPGRRAHDLERYQTVYADRARQVAVAAPTAGLHFTPELLADLERAGVATAEVTLHVGLGTFRPVATATIEAHPIHRERYELPAATAEALHRPGGRRVAVGTTTVRAIEDYLGREEPARDAAFRGEAGIYLYPPCVFRGVDALITNFHQPRSTLLCLVAAFLAPGSLDGIAWLKEIYAEAIAREFRFLSYGDAMLIV